MIQTTTNKNIYLGDGTTRKFAITFQYETKNNTKQIDLYTCTYSTESGTTKYNNDVQQITTNYDYVIEDGVTYVKYPSDAAVSDGASPMEEGTAIIIMRNTPNEQLSTGQYNSAKVEQQLDRVTMVAQELQEQVNRCVKAPKYAETLSETDFEKFNENFEEVLDIANDVNTVADNISSVTACANDLTNIDNASTYATNAANSASEASGYATNASGYATNASNSATAASNSATAASNAVTSCQTITNNAVNSINRPLLSFIWSDHLINNQAWLRADTFSWQSGETYLSAYNHLLEDIGVSRYFIPDDGFDTKFYRKSENDTTMFAWSAVGATLYTENEFPNIGDNFYYQGAIAGTVGSTGVEWLSYIKTLLGGDKHYPRKSSADSGGMYAWEVNASTVYYTNSPTPQVGDDVYLGSGVLTTVSEFVGITQQTETISGTTITYYQANDGHKIVLADQETNVSTIYAATGIAWYYILDTTNTRFKLPRTQYAFVGLRDTAGKYVPETLPSPTISEQMYSEDGAVQNHIADGGNTTGATWSYTIIDDIYKVDAPVQQRATQMYLYFYVGQFTQSATEQTAGLNSELFNAKADLDLNNINPSSSAKEMIVSWSMPDYNSGIAITYPISTSPYTCPSDGIIFGKIAESGDSVNNSIYINGVEYDISRSSSSTWRAETICMPFSKGDVIYFSSTPVSITGFSQLYFAPMKGV